MDQKQLTEADIELVVRHPAKIDNPCREILCIITVFGVIHLGV